GSIARRIRTGCTRNGRAAHKSPSRRAPRLVYVSDESPGISRLRRGRGFLYRNCQGRLICNQKTLDRIQTLAIPPAWTAVWICRLPNGHLQATGRDARGRKQYRYHPAWREFRDATKFDRLADFGRSLPAIREKIEAGLRLPGLPREKVL